MNNCKLAGIFIYFLLCPPRGRLFGGRFCWPAHRPSSKKEKRKRTGPDRWMVHVASRERPRTTPACWSPLTVKSRGTLDATMCLGWGPHALPCARRRVDHAIRAVVRGGPPPPLSPLSRWAPSYLQRHVSEDKTQRPGPLQRPLALRYSAYSPRRNHMAPFFVTFVFIRFT